MGKGDKIKEKPLFLLFAQVSTFSIFFTFQFFLLSEGHMKQKNGGQGHSGGSFRSELGHIGHFNTYFSVNRPELTRIWKKKKKKKKAAWTRCQQHRAPHTTSSVSAVALEPHPYFLG